MMKTFDIVWSEGMLLSQQHLQQFQARIASAMQAFHQKNNPFNFGVFDFKVNESSLLNGIFQLEACKGFYKCGYKFDLEAPITLSDIHPGSVYFCLSKKTAISGLAGYPSASSSYRYKAHAVEIEDFYDSNRTIKVTVKVENYFLTQALPDQQDYFVLKLAEVTRMSSGAYHLSDNYYASCLNLFCIPFFERYLNRFVSSIKIQLHLFDNSSYQVNNPIVYAIRRFLAELQCCYHQKSVHPWAFYQIGYGFIATISESFSIEYAHDNLSAMLEFMEKKLKSVLKQHLPKKITLIALERQTDALFYSASLADVLKEEMDLYLHLPLPETDARVGLFCQQAKITPLSDIQLTISASLPGIPLKLVQKPPAEFKQTGCFILLEKNNQYWESMLEEKRLAIFLTNDFLTLNITLFAGEKK